jgi:hypothetical protein
MMFLNYPKPHSGNGDKRFLREAVDSPWTTT